MRVLLCVDGCVMHETFASSILCSIVIFQVLKIFSSNLTCFMTKSELFFLALLWLACSIFAGFIDFFFSLAITKITSKRRPEVEESRWTRSPPKKVQK